MINLFISYRRENGYVSKVLFEGLKKRKIHAFYDLDKIKSGKFNNEIFSKIDKSDFFILVLKSNDLDRCSDEEDWVRKEIEYALKKNKTIINFMMDDFEFPKNLPASIDDIRHFNGPNKVSVEYFDAAIDKLVDMINVDGENQTGRIIKKREQNKYFTYDNTPEIERLATQEKIFKKFDQKTYNKAIDSLDKLIVLDVGCNTGNAIMDRVGNNLKLDKLIGIEYDKKTVEIANQEYGNDNIKFYSLDVEAEDFVNSMEKVMKENNISSFNIINISMLILHLKNPDILLERIYDFLDDDGYLIIMDIDDGFNIAFPDEDNAFSNVKNICSRLETSGFRNSGRQIYSWLVKTDYNKISLENIIISTVGMNHKERKALFITYFGFIAEDLKIMIDRYPDSIEYQDDYKWYMQNYEILKERFQSPELFWSLGTMLFLVQK